MMNWRRIALRYLALAPLVSASHADIQLTNMVAYARQRIQLDFDRPIEQMDLDPFALAIEPNLQIRARRFRPEGKRITLETPPFEIGKAYTLKTPKGTIQRVFNYDKDLVQHGLVAQLGHQGESEVYDLVNTNTPFTLKGMVQQSQAAIFEFASQGHLGKSFPHRFDDGYSVCLWVKTKTIDQPTNTGIFNNFSNRPGEPPAGFQLEISATDSIRYQWRCAEQTRILGPVTSDWVHLAVVAKANHVTLYYNEQWTNSAKVRYNGQPFKNLTLGVNRGNKRFFRGTITGLRVYDYPLYPGQIEALVAQTHPDNPPHH